MLDAIVTDHAIAQRVKQPQAPLTLQQKIVREQVRLIYKQGPTLSLGAAAAAACITFLATKSDASVMHALWLLVVAISALLRLLLFRFFSRENGVSSDPDADCRQWGRKFAMGSMLAGIVWAAWPVLFYANCSTEYLLMISALFAGMVAVLASSGSVYLPAFYCFAVPLCFPMAYYHVTSGVEVLAWTGWLLVMFFFVNLALALRGNRHYAALIEARFRNSDLMRQLAAEKQLAETAVREKNSFIAAASHDLRQPLHALSLFVASLQRGRLSERQLATVNDMQKSCSALNEHFNGILDVSRLDSDSIPVIKGCESVISLLRFLESDFRADADEKGIGLILDLPAQPLYIDTDRLLFERVLRNVVGNAIRFTRIGGVTIKLRYRLTDNGLMEPGLDDIDLPQTAGEMVLTVADTGPGVPLHEQPLIFNDYHRGANGATAAGLGLGLAIVKRLCRLLNMTLQLESKPGEGCKFHITSPVTQCAHPEVQPRVAEANQLQKLNSDANSRTVNLPPTDITLEGQAGDASVCDRTLENCTILVIDDEPAILAASKSILASLGAGTLLANGLSEAKEAIAEQASPPDVIVCDYRLPGEFNGVEIVEKLRHQCGIDIPACIITGDTSPERLRVVSASGLPVLYKPLSATQLEARLLTLLA